LCYVGLLQDESRLSALGDFRREDHRGIEAKEIGDAVFEPLAGDSLAGEDESQMLVTHAHALSDGPHGGVLEDELSTKRSPHL